MSTRRPLLTLAHSADADDVFMWWPITGKIDPRDPSRVLAPPAIETRRFTYRSVPDDIQALNARATASGDLDITAVSMFAFGSLHDRYVLTRCGWSVGEGFGPKLVTRQRSGVTIETLRGTGKPPRDPTHTSPARIAVPGLQTTAYLLLTLLLGTSTPASYVPVPMRFDEITGAVLRGEVAAGVLIHESQLDFERLGLDAIMDLGAWWNQHAGVPLPLGANVVRRDCESRFGRGSLREIEDDLALSIRYALTHRAEGLAYARTFAPPLSDGDLDRYIRMYVGAFTVDAGELGRAAVAKLLASGAQAGLCPEPGPIRFAGEV